MTIDPFFPPVMSCPWCPWAIRSIIHPVPVPVAEKMYSAAEWHLAAHSEQLHREIAGVLAGGAP